MAGFVDRMGSSYIPPMAGKRGKSRRVGSSFLSLPWLSLIKIVAGQWRNKPRIYIRPTGALRGKQGRIEASVEGVSEESTLALVDPTLYDIYFLDEKTGWMVGEFGKIYHSTDGGATWKEQQNALLGQAGIDDALNLPTWFGVRFVNATEGTVVGLEGKIAKTTDGGQTWTYTAEDLAATSTDPLYALRLSGNGGGWIVGASASGAPIT